MCEPTVIAMTATAAVSAGVAIHRSRQQAQVQETNADLVRQQAGRVLQKGETQASTIEAQGRRVAASGLAQAGASGVDPSTGSTATVLAQSEANAAADASQVRANAAMEAWGLGVEEQSLQTQAKITRHEGILSAGAQGVRAAGGIAGATARSGLKKSLLSGG